MELLFSAGKPGLLSQVKSNSGDDMKKTVITIIIVLLVIVVGGVGFFRSYVHGERIKMQVGEVDLSRVSDSVYNGEHPYFGLVCKVEVEVKNNRIVNIKVDEDRSSEYVDKAKMVTQNVLLEQSLDVDTITGATFTSKAILKAVENALKGHKTKQD